MTMDSVASADRRGGVGGCGCGNSSSGNSPQFAMESRRWPDRGSVSRFYVQATHVWPRVTARGAVRFETIRLGNVSYNPVIVDNPSDQPLMIQAYISTIGGPEINAIVGAQHCELNVAPSLIFRLTRSFPQSGRHYRLDGASPPAPPSIFDLLS